MISGVDICAYEAAPEWGRVPKGFELGEVAAVAVDRDDNVYAFNRGPHPVVVFDPEGSFVSSWGEGLFVRPHGLQMSSSGYLFCTDEGAHVVRRCTLEGEVSMTLGEPGVASGFHSGEPFNRCTHTAESPDGSIYVSDGYGNARIHKYSSDAKYLFSWGRSGTGPGEFNLPHNIACDKDGLVYVADRENHRIQVFDGDGHFEEQWHDLHRPSAIFLERSTPPVMYVAEIGPYWGAISVGPILAPGSVSWAYPAGPSCPAHHKMRQSQPVRRPRFAHGIAIDSVATFTLRMSPIQVGRHCSPMYRCRTSCGRSTSGAARTVWLPPATSVEPR